MPESLIVVANIRIYVLPSFVNNILQLPYKFQQPTQRRVSVRYGGNNNLESIVHAQKMPNREKKRDGETNEERYYFSCHCLVYARGERRERLDKSANF